MEATEHASRGFRRWRKWIVAGSAAAFGLGGCGGSSASNSDQEKQAATTVTRTTTVTAPKAPPPQPKLRISVRRPRRVVSGETAVVRGKISIAGASVTIRGLKASSKGRAFARRLPLRVGVNRFTIVARKEGAQTARRVVRITRKPIAAVPPKASAPTPACPSGQQLLRKMDSFYCGVPGPAQDCPPGQVAVGETGACAPPDPAVPDTNGPNDPCPPGENYVEPDGCVGGGF